VHAVLSRNQHRKINTGSTAAAVSAVNRKVRDTVGGIVAGCSALLIFVAFFLVYGDTFPSHVGATRDAHGELSFQLALCPDEQITAVEVSTQAKPRQIWRVTGPGSTQDAWIVNSAPPAGFAVEATPAPGAFASGQVSVQFRTNHVKYWGGEFDVADVTGGSILFEGTHVDPAQFTRTALHRYPCNDPDGKKNDSRWSSRALLVAALLGGAAVILLHQRKVKPPLEN
jgi:hypothetical protein